MEAVHGAHKYQSHFYIRVFTMQKTASGESSVRAYHVHELLAVGPHPAGTVASNNFQTAGRGERYGARNRYLGVGYTGRGWELSIDLWQHGAPLRELRDSLEFGRPL